MIKTLLSSKKFLASLSGMLFVVLNDCLKLGVSETAVIQVVSLLAAYVVGQGVADFGKEKPTSVNVVNADQPLMMQDNLIINVLERNKDRVRKVLEQ